MTARWTQDGMMHQSKRLTPFSLAFVLLLLAGLVGCKEQPGPSPEAVEPEDELVGLASREGGVPLEGKANRVGVPTSGATTAAAGTVADSDDDDEPKDYWKPIPFDRSNFEEVRKFVRDRYIESAFDESLAYAEAAGFALASDEKIKLQLLPESFYKARKDHPDEEGRLQGKMTKLQPDDPFVIVEVADKKDEEKKDDAKKDDKKKKRLTDEEIAELRIKNRTRNKALDDAWKASGFGAAEFNRVMEYAAAKLGKDPDWSMKRAWVAAAQGYLYSLDPHSALIPKQAWEDSTRETTDSSFEGIGAILTRRPDSEFTIVESPIEGQPAVRAGLRAGDMIMKVDGNSIKGEILSKVVSRIRGKKGSPVVLTVQREGVPDPVDIRIVRAHIDIKNVSGRLVKHHEDIGYVKVTGFVPTTDAELGRMIRKLEGKTKSGKLRGLILDLRSNSGGLLKQGIQVADRFLDQGVIVTVKSRGGRDEVHRATPGMVDFPVVVLTNDSSASASEIVASAIQENGRGLVVGDRTFGKASVQTLFSPLLRDDYYIKLTVARYYSPLGRTLQVIGVKPDMTVAPEVGGKMPLGFREEDLSHHLPPLDSAYPKVNETYRKRIETCVKASGRAEKIYKADPNPAVKFDFQKLYGADVLECMASNPSAVSRR